MFFRTRGRISERVLFGKSIRTPAGGSMGEALTHYVAIVEEEEGRAVGVWFPDLPGCFSAGDSLDEALVNARDALALYAETVTLPRPRTLTELKADPDVAGDLAAYMVALIPLSSDLFRPAAE